MARRVNYNFEKRQKELNRQKKNEEKAERKRQKKEAATAEHDAIGPEGPDVDPLDRELGERAEADGHE